MYQNTKSATTAGLLGIFLGAFGAHNWYLGEKGKGIAHVCMMSGGILVEIIAGAVLPNVLSWSALLTWATILPALAGIAGLMMSASGIWGLVEGIIVLSQGDAGLARKGYAVAAPAPMPMQQNYGQYGQPMGGQPMGNYGQGQPMGMNNGYGQPMNNYGAPGNMSMDGNINNGMVNNMNGNINPGENINMNENNMNGGQNGQ